MPTSPYIEPGYIEPGYFEGDVIDAVGRIIEIRGIQRLIEIRGMSRLIEIHTGDQVSTTEYVWSEEMDPDESKAYSVSWEDELIENGNETIDSPPDGMNYFEVPEALAGKLNISNQGVNAAATIATA